MSPRAQPMDAAASVGAAPATALISEPAVTSWKVPAAMTGVLLLWASAFIAIRVLGETFSPGPMALGRLAVGTLVLALIALPRRPALPRGRGLAMVLVYGLTWFAAYNVVLNAAEQHLDAGTAAMLVNIAPMLVAVAAGLFLAEGFPRPLMVGILVGFTGVTLIALAGDGQHTDRFGVVLGVIAAVMYAVGVLAQKVALRTVDPLSATWLGAAVGTVVLLPYLPQAITEFTAAPAGPLLAVVYLGVFPTAVAFTLWAYVLTRSTAGRTASATLAVPALAVLMSWLLLAEVPTVPALVGGALCLVGVGITRRVSRPAPRQAIRVG